MSSYSTFTTPKIWLRASIIVNVVLVAMLAFMAYKKVWIPYQQNQDALHGPTGVKLEWYDLKTMGVEGKGWKQTEGVYTRLPATAKGQVPPKIWELGQESAGLQVRFVTDATSLHVRWTLTSHEIAAPHMSATGLSGLDLYVRKGERWAWAAIARPYQFPHNTSFRITGANCFVVCRWRNVNTCSICQSLME